MRLASAKVPLALPPGLSKGVFNGGAWLEIDRRRSDVHYRDLDTIDHEIGAERPIRSRSPSPPAPHSPLVHAGHCQAAWSTS